MFGLTEFDIFHEKKGWVVTLVTGKDNKIVMTGTKYYSTADAAYAVAERLWKKLKLNEATSLLPVRFVDLK